MTGCMNAYTLFFIVLYLNVVVFYYIVFKILIKMLTIINIKMILCLLSAINQPNVGISYFFMHGNWKRWTTRRKCDWRGACLRDSYWLWGFIWMHLQNVLELMGLTVQSFRAGAGVTEDGAAGGGSVSAADAAHGWWKCATAQRGRGVCLFQEKLSFISHVSWY